MKVRTQAAVFAVFMAMAVPVFAQQPPNPPTPPQPPAARRGNPADTMRPRMLNVEAALRFKEQLKLSDAQTAQLETLRKEIVAERQAEAREAIETHSRARAGLISEDAVRKQFEAKRDQLRQSMQQRRERIEKILTTEQQQQLQRETRNFMMDRMHDRMRGRHGRMSPGMRMRDRMGPGFMPPRRGFD